MTSDEKREHENALARARRAANPERARERQNRWRRDNPDKIRAYDKKARAKLTDYYRDYEQQYSNRKWELMLKRKYGITAAQWLAMFEAQGRCCANCGSDDPKSRFGWHTDHDKATKRVRGILCRQCNQILGHLGDNADAIREWLNRAARYLGGAL